MTTPQIFIDGNYVLVENTAFDLGNVPQTYNRLLIIGMDCNSVYNKCQGYSLCVSYTVLYYQKPPTGLNYANMDSYANDIVAYLIVVNFDNHVEIYDVCTSQIVRGKGIGKGIIATTLKWFGTKNVWLGVMLDNPSFEAAIRLYVSSGFGAPTLAQKTPGGLDVGGKWFISLIYSKNLVTDKDKTLNQIFEMRANYLACNTPFYISHALAGYFKNLIYGTEGLAINWELAGTLGSVGIITIDNIQHYYLGLSLPLVEGDKTTPIVHPPKDMHIVFHTHPVSCYLKFGCYLGWPSGEDMKYSVDAYNFAIKKLLQFVITAEGIYSVKLRPQFMEVLDFLNDQKSFLCLNIIGGIVRDRFGVVEQSRKIEKTYGALQTAIKFTNDEFIRFKDTQQKEKVKREYLNNVNEYTFKDLIDDLERNYPQEKGNMKICTDSLKFKFFDFILFEVGFRSWDDVDKGVTTGILTSHNPGQQCPIDIPIDFSKAYVS